MDSNSKTDAELAILFPERPIEPLDSECCGTGCTPCVFDIFKKQLSKWEKDCKDILRSGIGIPNQDLGISPYCYKDFEIIDISIDPDSQSVKIFTFNCVPRDNNNSIDTVRSQSVFAVEIGQHVVLKIGVISRKYTVLRVNETNNTFDILVKIYSAGPMTQLLDKLVVGDCVQTRGPFGDQLKYEPNTYKNIVMLAGGSGFAPMYRIIETILENEDDETRIQLIFASKTLEDIPLRKKLIEWSLYWNFQVFHFLSTNDDDLKVKIPYGMNVVFQRLNYECLTKHFENGFQTSRTFYYICGTKSFEKDMVNYLTKLNVDSNDVVVF